MIERLHALVAFMKSSAANHDETFASHIAAGHLDAYLDDIAYLSVNRDAIVVGVL